MGHRGIVDTGFLAQLMKRIFPTAGEEDVKAGLIKDDKRYLLIFGRSVKALRASRSI